MFVGGEVAGQLFDALLNVFDNAGMLGEFLVGEVAQMAMVGPVAQNIVVGHDEGGNELTLVADNRYLLEDCVAPEAGFQGLRGNVFAV